MSNQIVELPEEVDFFNPPNTHLIADVKDLTDVLKGTTDEVDDTEEEVGESTDS